MAGVPGKRGAVLIHLDVVDMMPADEDGTGHWPGIECPCAPDTLTDGKGTFLVYHSHLTERML